MQPKCSLIANLGAPAPFSLSKGLVFFVNSYTIAPILVIVYILVIVFRFQCKMMLQKMAIAKVLSLEFADHGFLC